MNAALERFCFPVEEELLESEELLKDVSRDSVKNRCDRVRTTLLQSVWCNRHIRLQG